MKGDRDLLFQCVANILDNAIKYTPAGGRIVVELHGERRYVRVCDGGPGIPQEAREKVFRRFYRLDTSRSTAGSGLGLSLVAAVARLHNMEVTLGDNDPGLCVTLTMPESGSARSA
jgi:signal transduction histidine kinase